MSKRTVTEPLCVVHENHLGERRYQPQVDGTRLGIHRIGTLAGEFWEKEWCDSIPWEWIWEPVLYRSRRKAERVARREIRRRERALRNEFKEAEHD